MRVVRINIPISNPLLDVYRLIKVFNGASEAPHYIANKDTTSDHKAIQVRRE
jgi:hypothetical protein